MLKTQETYRSEVEFIDKDHIASMFMANCEMNEVYDEMAYYLFVAEIVGKDESYFKDELIQASLSTEREIQRQLNEVALWYENQFYIDDHFGVKYVKDEWRDYDPINERYEDPRYSKKLNKAREEKIQAIHNNRDNIYQNYLKTYKKNKVLSDWKNIGYKKVFDSTLKYQSTWTYDDVLRYFKTHGFPIKRQSAIEALESNLNVCKVRHILRNDIMIDEAILLALLEMQERKDWFEEVAEDKKFWQAFMLVVSIIVAIGTAFIPGGQAVTGWLLAAQIAGYVASAASMALSIYNMISSAIQEEEMKEITQKTNDLMLRNMPKSANFVDTAITDPYSMYANGRLWKEGAAGRERYDQMLPHEPYRALDDKFKDSDMYDILNNKNEKSAGGDQYLSNLYSDGKWVNPSSLKAVLNGAVPIYLSMRTKIVEACFKWLSKNDLGTYYLYENHPDDDEYLNRFSNIEFENINDVMGFTAIVSTYYMEAKTSDLGLSATDLGGRPLEKIQVVVGCIHSTKTQWDKDNDNKTEKKTHNITEHANITLVKSEKKTLKGSDIQLFYILSDTNTYHRNINRLFKSSDRFSAMDNILLQKKGANAFVKHGRRIVDVNKSYECEYEVWNYGGVEVKYYKSIKEVGTNKAVGIRQTEPIAQTYKCYKWLVREEAKARIRFKDRKHSVHYTANIFSTEELKTPCVPYMQVEMIKDDSFNIFGNPSNKEIEVVGVYRYFDRNTRFAYRKNDGFSATLGTGYIAVADTPSKDYVEVTIYHKEKDESITTYFGISPFLNAKRNITMF
ncbi:hypothetical protein [Helicobacter bilis]|uniref:hypothetical protein n=1 Tax=Helicobacter bilis TaxID=37372 RepID=UPI000CF031D8|nr:hypothetical protein [Helicobacter bilis]